MHVLVSILIIIALVLAVIYFLPGACDKDIDKGPGIGIGGNGSDNGNGSGNGNGNDDGDVGINITTGKVKVDIVNLKNESLVGSVLKFEGEANGGEVLFQPGSVFYTQGFKIKNVGNVKISYRMFVTNEESIDMEAFQEAFDFYVVTDPADISSGVQMLSFSGVLDPDKVSETYYVVVAMKETAGNEFQDREFNGIGITVNATQKTEG